MPDHLPSATCEALAAALPEVREHRFTCGESVWLRDDANPEWQFVRGASNLGLMLDGKPLHPGERWLWCPALSDLLPIADKVAAPYCVRLEKWTAIEDRVWAFGIADVEGFRDDPCFGKTPEAAVAAWLVHRIEEAQPHA